MSSETLIYNRLVEVACAGKTIGRDAVAGLLGLNLEAAGDRQDLVRILDNLAYRENAEGRPLISAVVILPEIGYPDRAFFMLARELGFNTFGDDRSYYYYELKRVHTYWKNHAPIPTGLAYQPAEKHSAVLVAG
jgi:hypothetical protein